MKGGNRILGKRLKALRKKRKISQEDLAHELGVSHYTVSSYECDRSDPDDRIKIALAEFFDVSVDYLLGLVDEPYSYKTGSDCVFLPDSLSESDKNAVKKYVEFLKNENET